MNAGDYSIRVGNRYTLKPDYYGFVEKIIVTKIDDRWVYWAKDRPELGDGQTVLSHFVEQVGATVLDDVKTLIEACES